jgi:hypothetical protein
VQIGFDDGQGTPRFPPLPVGQDGYRLFLAVVAHELHSPAHPPEIAPVAVVGLVQLETWR